MVASTISGRMVWQLYTTCNALMLWSFHGRLTNQMLVALEPLRQLRELNVENAVTTPESFESLDSLPYLTRVYLGKMNLASANLESLSRCRTIQYVDLNDSIMPPDIVSHLCSMRSLTGINVQGTNLSDEDVQALKTALPGLRVEGQYSTRFWRSKREKEEPDDRR